MTGRERWWSRGLVWIVALMATAFTVTLALPPLLADGPAAVIRLLASPSCHQMPWRSLMIDGEPLAVCARCFGLYVGGSLGLWIYGFFASPGYRPPTSWFLAALGLNVLDVGLGLLGLPNLPNLPRALLGVGSGAVIGLFLGTGVAGIALHLAQGRGGTAPAPSADSESVV